MDVKILGTGCPNCIILEENTKEALDQLGLDYTIEKVTKMEDIMTYGVLSTPGLVVDGKVLRSGVLLSSQEILSLIEGI